MARTTRISRLHFLAIPLPKVSAVVFPERMKLSRWLVWTLIRLLVVMVLVPFESRAAATDSSLLVYFGTYTRGKSKGIYVSRFDTVTGKLSAPELAVETKNPSFLAVEPSKRFLYAVGEIDELNGKPTGAVNAFRMDRETGKLEFLNQQASGGTGPCHVSVDPTGKCVMVANYGGGSVAALPILEDGRLGPAGSVVQHSGSSVNPERQTGPHAHFIVSAPASDKDRVLVCDLGLDQVLMYRLNAETAKLSASQPPFVALKPGAGPRHLAFDPTGRTVYLINEMGGTLTVLGYDEAHDRLKSRQTISTLPADFKGKNTCAEVQVHPSGRFVYASNRGHDSIAVFKVEPRSGELTFVEHQPTLGKTPRHFALDPSGKWLLAENQDTGNVGVFQVDTATGRLSPTGQQVEIGAPVCSVFVAPESK
jgi:6-phosphogluconolactonase